MCKYIDGQNCESESLMGKESEISNCLGFTATLKILKFLVIGYMYDAGSGAHVPWFACGDKKTTL